MRSAWIMLLLLCAMAAEVTQKPRKLLLASEPSVSPVRGAWNSSILIGTHHKTGTVLLAKVFRLAAKLMGVPRSKANKTSASAACAELFEHQSPGVCIEEHTNMQVLGQWLRPEVPFVHVVRDPLEMCVSAYQYHLQGAEPWLLQPHAELGGQTLQQFYMNLSKAEGVAFECKRIMGELVDEALVFNASRARAATLNVFFEDFALRYDAVMRRIFEFLDSGSRVEELLKLAAGFDLSRHGAGDERHVSAADAKQPLRDVLHAEPLLRSILLDLQVLLGYSNEPPPKRSQLCESLRKLCSTTHVGFISWCANGRLAQGKLASFPECGDASPSKSAGGSNRTHPPKASG